MLLIDIGFKVHPFFFFQAEDGIRDLVRSRGLGDVYKRQLGIQRSDQLLDLVQISRHVASDEHIRSVIDGDGACLLYTSDAADDLPCVDLGGRRIIKKKITSHTESRPLLVT